MARLFGFDYKSPYFYMVTLKALKGVEAFSQIGPTGLIENKITKAFNTVIRSFHLKWRCLDEISPFVVMPDYIHLLIKIKEVEKPVALGVLVSQLSKALRAAYWKLRGGRRFSQNPPGSAQRCACAAPPDILEKSWHDWIVKKSGQLAAFRRYIKENPARAHLRLFRLLSPLGDLESWRSGGVKLLNSQSPKLQEAKAKKLKRLVVSG